MEKTVHIDMKPDGNLTMPKTVNKFRVLFENFGTNTNNEHLTKNIMKCSCPSIDLSFDLRQFGLFIRSDKWNDIKLTFRDDVTNIVYDQVMAQIRKQLGDETAVFDLRIQAMDGGSTILHETVLSNCKIDKHTSNDWDYSSAKPKTISLFITYSLA